MCCTSSSTQSVPSKRVLCDEFGHHCREGIISMCNVHSTTYKQKETLSDSGAGGVVVRL